MNYVNRIKLWPARFFIISLIHLICICLAHSQSLTPHIDFIKSYGGNSHDGSAFLGGFHFSQDGYLWYAGGSTSSTDDVSCNVPLSAKGWLLKTDKQGNKIFSRCFGGSLRRDSITQSYEFFTDMVATSDSGCIAACSTNAANIPPLSNFSYACDDSAHGYKQMSLVKFDKNGNVQWSHCYGGGQDDGIFSMDKTSDGGYIFLAQVRSLGGDVGMHYGSIFAADSWLVKVDSIGNIQWKRVLGGTGSDDPRKVREIAKGKYMACISTTSNDFDLQGITRYSFSDAWFCVFDSAGTIIKQGIVPRYGQLVDVYDFLTTPDDGIIWVGITDGKDTTHSCSEYSFGSGDFGIMRVDSNFAIKWCKTLGGTGQDRLTSVTAIGDSSFLACGSSSSPDFNSTCVINATDTNLFIDEGWMISFNSSGRILWQRCLSGSQGADAQYSLYDTASGSIFICGSGKSDDGDLAGVPNYGLSDEWIIKIDLVTGIKASDPKGPIVVYPNPSQKLLYAKLPGAEDGRITISDMTGKVHFTHATDKAQSEQVIDMSDLPAGVYVFQYQDLHMSVSRKVVKEN